MEPEKNSCIPQKREYTRHGFAISFDDNLLNKSNLEIIEYLKEKTVLFKDFSDELIEQVVPLSSIETYDAGDEILLEDSPNGKIYFLMRGVVGVYKGGEHVLKLRRKGDIFGEMSLISSKPCSATVKAESEVDVFSIQVRNIGEYTNIDENTIQDALYKLYAVILADKLAMTTFKAIDLEKKVAERTADLKLNNEKLRIAKEKADEANRSKSEFLSNMSHELRTPMHQILSYARIGINRFTSQKGKVLECFNNISFSGDRMMGLVNDLLDLSELESGRMKYTFAAYDIFVIITENLTSLGNVAEKKGITISIKQPPVPTKIVCDRQTISQAMYKLLSNTIKFTPEKKGFSVSFDSMNFSITGTPEEEPMMPSLRVSIKDEGLGIPDDELESIFDKFSQSSKTKTGAGGTGLGLAICYEIIKAHKGKIWAENNPDGGAVFNVLLPYEQV